MIIVKTTSEHVAGVRRHRKYATDDPPIDLRPGDEVLVQVTVLTAKGGPPTIRYRMKYVRSYPDKRGETRAIWGQRWAFIMECSDLCILRHPFDISRVQRSTKDYGAAIRYVYVDPLDVQALRAGGYLDCA